MPEEVIERALEQLRVALRRRTQRNVIREDVARIALSFDAPFSNNDLYAALRTANVRDATLALVYRTTPVLVELGVLERTFVSDPRRQYFQLAFGLANRDYLVCRDCNRTVPFDPA